MFSEGLIYLLITPTATCCYITMIITKHPLSWRCRVPYIYVHNIRWRLHNPTDIMRWYLASCLLLFCSEVRQSIHHFDRNCVNKQPIPLVQRPTSIASTMIEREYIVSWQYSYQQPRFNGRCRDGGLIGCKRRITRHRSEAKSIPNDNKSKPNTSAANTML
jgi:hypothetical protein